MAKQEFNDKNIALAWQKMAEEKFSKSLTHKTEIMDAIKMESNSNIAELKRRLKYKLYWTIGFFVLFASVLIIFINNPDMVILSGIVTGAYAIGFFPMYFKYKQIDDSISDTKDILESMKYNARMIKSVLKLEKIWGLVVFTPIILIGVFAGRVIDGHTIMETFNDPKILRIGLVLLIVFVPTLIWLTNKMNTFAFGGIIKKLEENIIKMETLK